MGICRGCGAALSKDQATCPFCGRTNDEYHPPERQTDKSDTSCPYCHLSDRTEKVTEIRRHDIQQIDGTIPVSHTSTDRDGRSYSYTSHERFTGTQSSDLANALIPPSEPQLPKVHGAGTWWLLVLLIYPGLGLIGGPIYGAIVHEDYLMLALAIIGALLGIVFCVFLFSRWKKRFNREVQEHPKKTISYIVNHTEWECAIKRWQQLYYCYRDGHVFVPGCGDSMPVDKIMSYLYKSEDAKEIQNTSIVCPMHGQCNRIINVFNLFQDNDISRTSFVNYKRSIKDLQKLITPPTPPSQGLGFGFYLGWWLIGYYSLPLIFTFFIWWKAYQKAIAERKKTIQKSTINWHGKINKWMQLMYCPDCDIVFDPETDKIYDLSGDFKQYLLSVV